MSNPSEPLTPEEPWATLTDKLKALLIAVAEQGPADVEFRTRELMILVAGARPLVARQIAAAEKRGREDGREDRDYFRSAYARKLGDEKNALEWAAALSEENARLREQVGALTSHRIDCLAKHGARVDAALAGQSRAAGAPKDPGDTPA